MRASGSRVGLGLGRTILTKKKFSILDTALLRMVPIWSPTPASRIPNIGIPTRA